MSVSEIACFSVAIILYGLLLMRLARLADRCAPRITTVKEEKEHMMISAEVIAVEEVHGSDPRLQRVYARTIDGNVHSFEVSCGAPINPANQVILDFEASPLVIFGANGHAVWRSVSESVKAAEYDLDSDADFS